MVSLVGLVVVLLLLLLLVAMAVMAMLLLPLALAPASSLPSALPWLLKALAKTTEMADQ